MFVRLRITRNANAQVYYHQRKVDKGEAKLIGSRNFLHPTGQLTYPDMIFRFRRLNDFNPGCKGNMVNVIISLADEKASDQKLADIGHRYMESMGLENQPYLIYKHSDAAHPHIHILGNLIQPDGKTIPIYPIVMIRREQVRQQLQREFDVGALRKQRTPWQEAEQAQKLKYGSSTLSKEMSKVLHHVLQDYHFTSMDEYNAILRGYNMWACVVKSPNHGNRVGLVYQTVNEEGRQIGKHLPASYFENKPTWKHLQRIWAENALADEERNKHLSNKVKSVLYHQPATLLEYGTELQKKGIAMVVIPGIAGSNHQLVYVDRKERFAMQASRMDGTARDPRIGEKITTLMAKAYPWKIAIPQRMGDLLNQAKQKGLEEPAEELSLSLKQTQKLRRHV